MFRGSAVCKNYNSTFPLFELCPFVKIYLRFFCPERNSKTDGWILSGGGLWIVLQFFISLLLFNWIQNRIEINSIQIKWKTKQVQSCIGVIKRNPSKQKVKTKSPGGTWIGFTFQLLLLYPQTHPGPAKWALFKNKKEPRSKKKRIILAARPCIWSSWNLKHIFPIPIR